MCVRILFWGLMFIIHVLHFQNVYVFSEVKHVLHEKKHYRNKIVFIIARFTCNSCPTRLSKSVRSDLENEQVQSLCVGVRALAVTADHFHQLVEGLSDVLVPLKRLPGIGQVLAARITGWLNIWGWLLGLGRWPC